MLRGEQWLSGVRRTSSRDGELLAHLISCILQTLFWLWTGWTSGSGAVREDSRGYRAGDAPAKPAYGGDRLPLWLSLAIPLGTLYFTSDHAGDAAEHAVALPSAAAMAFFIGIEVQKASPADRWGRWRAPSTFWCWITRCSSSSASFLDSALGQIVSCFLALMVILVRDNSRARTGQVLLNQFVSAAVSSLTTNSARRKENRICPRSISSCFITQ